MLLSCMTNLFYLAGSASDTSGLFPKIQSTSQRRGRVHSEDAHRDVLEALETDPQGKCTRGLNL